MSQSPWNACHPSASQSHCSLLLFSSCLLVVYTILHTISAGATHQPALDLKHKRKHKHNLDRMTLSLFITPLLCCARLGMYIGSNSPRGIVLPPSLETSKHYCVLSYRFPYVPLTHSRPPPNRLRICTLWFSALPFLSSHSGEQLSLVSDDAKACHSRDGHPTAPFVFSLLFPSCPYHPYFFHSIDEPSLDHKRKHTSQRTTTVFIHYTSSLLRPSWYVHGTRVYTRDRFTALVGDVPALIASYHTDSPLFLYILALYHIRNDTGICALWPTSVIFHSVFIHYPHYLLRSSWRVLRIPVSMRSRSTALVGDILAPIASYHVDSPRP